MSVISPDHTNLSVCCLKVEQLPPHMALAYTKCAYMLFYELQSCESSHSGMHYDTVAMDHQYAASAASNSFVEEDICNPFVEEDIFYPFVEEDISNSFVEEDISNSFVEKHVSNPFVEEDIYVIHLLKKMKNFEHFSNVKIEPIHSSICLKCKTLHVASS